MDQRVKKLWISALTDGSYHQGSGQLKRPSDAVFDLTRHCCLGVLCELYLQEHPEARWDNGLFVVAPGRAEGEFLPPQVVAWAGLKTHDPMVAAENEDANSLAGINDAGVSFNVLAKKYIPLL